MGLNGAGKTTLIKMLVGETKMTAGHIYINGYDSIKNYTRARKNFGYCPQFSYLPEFLHTEECLQLFANLKGLNGRESASIIDDLIKLFRLTKFRRRMVQHLRFTFVFFFCWLLLLNKNIFFYKSLNVLSSEGNKKKLSAALAFLGRPSVAILDEVCGFFFN